MKMSYMKMKKWNILWIKCKYTNHTHAVSVKQCLYPITNHNHKNWGTIKPQSKDDEDEEEEEKEEGINMDTAVD